MSLATCQPANSLLYNSKELDKDLGLNWYHYGARYYDPAVGRFTGVDPLAPKYSFQSPYAYAVNNPLRFIDFKGLGPGDPPEVVEHESTIRNNFTFDQDCRNCGTDLVIENQTTETIERNDEGTELSRTTTLTTTTGTVEADGSISDISKSQITTISVNSSDGIKTTNKINNIGVVGKGQTSTDFQKAVDYVSAFKKSNGISPVQQKAIDNGNKKDIAETVGDAATVTGGILSFTPHPASQGAGKVIGAVGIASLGVSSTTETNPEKITIKLK
ncbi:MAG TPA: RHS repeat-associated core domain-containing protein [Bacteroidetes bacterium]|nr:RHS repeat-associated core domain-containing protein [Bacteroidota bacterium]